ncbi:ATP-binding protein [Engelhardtia mirabilis]|uniref:histidine kinase n=1 Tax=Engelhardtia mirabilis TaxID=2528011 RepID=A0A518BIY4_9BACT|nr:Sensor protein ZraS [Planctomycetes bacterium Pla133]QDV01230.1 Sensor protein ZraS [Planctomycetes bacterium Pla86]
MFGSISTKLLVAVLATVALPFAGFAFFIEHRVADTLMLELVRQTLKGLAADLADQVDAELEDRQQDVRLWAAEPIAAWAVKEHTDGRDALQSGTTGLLDGWGPEATLEFARTDGDFFTYSLFRSAQVRSFDNYVREREHYALLLLVDSQGELVVCNSRDHEGRPLERALLSRLFDHDWSAEGWFDEALQRGTAQVDQHVSPWLFPDGAAGGAPEAEGYHIGLASSVGDYLQDDVRLGVLVALVDWSAFQDLVSTPVIQETFRGLVASSQVPSPYGWIWASDGDTILAHKERDLYGVKVSSMGLGQMRDDALSADSGLYREYTFEGVEKNAAFCHTDGPEAGGFGWIVGVGIDNADIYAATSSLRDELFRGTVFLLLAAVLLVMFVARRMTAPILALEAHTRRVAGGDLDARIDIASADEVGRLAAAFNRMTGQLAEQRRKLVKAEKDAAWREMARQIAHDIKNPLTPIQLSLDLLERARAENSPQADEILERTMAMMRRQVAELREIATDFYEFTGGRRARPETVELRVLVDEVLALHRAWAEEHRVAVAVEGRGLVHADPGKLRRVLTNLVSNALFAMGEGGDLEATITHEGSGVVLELRDTGVGLDPAVLEHLFEPYFTTRSEGTGLGLAISKRAVEEAGGTIDLHAAADDGRGGTVARVWLPGPPTGATAPR